MSQGRRKTGDSFTPDLYQRPRPVVELAFGPKDAPAEAARSTRQARWWSAQQIEVEQPVELEYLHCPRCGRETVHVPVYWYMHRHAYQPPLELSTGDLLAGLEARIEVLWCVGHRGDPPVRYPKPVPVQ